MQFKCVRHAKDCALGTDSILECVGQYGTALTGFIVLVVYSYPCRSISDHVLLAFLCFAPLPYSIFPASYTPPIFPVSAEPLQPRHILESHRRMMRQVLAT